MNSLNQLNKLTDEEDMAYIELVMVPLRETDREITLMGMKKSIIIILHNSSRVHFLRGCDRFPSVSD